MSALASALPAQTFARDDADNNIRGSADQLAQTITEADAAKDEDLRRELLGRAAREALSEGQLTSAVDLIMRIKPRDEKDSEEFISYRDQFLGDVVRSSITRKDYDALAYAATRIREPLQRATALQRLALYFFETKDTVRAREVLADALKIVESASDDAPKAAALLNLAVAYLKIDDMHVFPTIHAALKIIDNLPGLMPGVKPGSEAHLKYVQMLLQLAYNLVPVFHLLSQKDEIGTFSAANRLHLPELKASAILGASTGVPGVWGTPKAPVRSK
jgi:tetratricopeptide (TPR) repeat protein